MLCSVKKTSQSYYDVNSFPARTTCGTWTESSQLRSFMKKRRTTELGRMIRKLRRCMPRNEKNKKEIGRTHIETEELHKGMGN